MELHTLSAISPIDGRYRSQVDTLAAYFSEFALMQYRLRVETEYFVALSNENIFKLPSQKANKMKSVYMDFNNETEIGRAHV